MSLKRGIALSSRILLGIVFTFSGFVKSVDPQGFAYKIQDYFTAFGLDVLHPAAYLLAVFLVSLEFYTGLLLLFDELRKFSSLLVMLFMAFFTPLTLYLAIANPVSDCGCFGDAIKLSNWQTFWKNVPLLMASIYLFVDAWQRKRKSTEMGGRCTKCPIVRNILFPTLLGLLALFPAIWATRHLPMIDFRPFHISANLHDGMAIPDNAPQDEFRTEFVYEKDGVEKKFTEYDYPWEDSTWHYVSSENILVQRGYEPPIHDFALEQTDGTNYVNALLAPDSTLKLLVVTPFLQTLTTNDIQTLNALQAQATINGIALFHATASSQGLQQELRQSDGLQTTLYTTNERTLKTIVRASTGVVLLRNAIVLDKWTLHDLPDISYFGSKLQDKNDEELYGAGGYRIVWIFWSIVVLIGIARVITYYCSRCKFIKQVG